MYDHPNVEAFELDLGSTPADVWEHLKGRPADPIEDPEVELAIQSAWNESVGAPEFKTDPGEPCWGDGTYEGCRFREAAFVIKADGTPSEIQVGKYPDYVENVSVPRSALGSVHTHAMKRAKPADTVTSGPALTKDEKALLKSKVPVYIIAQNDILKLYLDGNIIRKRTFRRKRRGASKPAKGNFRCCGVTKRLYRRCPSCEGLQRDAPAREGVPVTYGWSTVDPDEWYLAGDDELGLHFDKDLPEEQFEEQKKDCRGRRWPKKKRLQGTLMRDSVGNVNATTLSVLRGRASLTNAPTKLVLPVIMQKAFARAFDASFIIDPPTYRSLSLVEKRRDQTRTRKKYCRVMSEQGGRFWLTSDYVYATFAEAAAPRTVKTSEASTVSGGTELFRFHTHPGYTKHAGPLSNTDVCNLVRANRPAYCWILTDEDKPLIVLVVKTRRFGKRDRDAIVKEIGCMKPVSKVALKTIEGLFPNNHLLLYKGRLNKPLKRVLASSGRKEYELVFPTRDNPSTAPSFFQPAFGGAPTQSSPAWHHGDEEEESGPNGLTTLLPEDPIVGAQGAAATDTFASHEDSEICTLDLDQDQEDIGEVMLPEGSPPLYDEGLENEASNFTDALAACDMPRKRRAFFEGLKGMRGITSIAGFAKYVIKEIFVESLKVLRFSDKLAMLIGASYAGVATARGIPMSEIAPPSRITDEARRAWIKGIGEVRKHSRLVPAPLNELSNVDAVNVLFASLAVHEFCDEGGPRWALAAKLAGSLKWPPR